MKRFLMVCIPLVYVLEVGFIVLLDGGYQHITVADLLFIALVEVLGFMIFAPIILDGNVFGTVVKK